MSTEGIPEFRSESKPAAPSLPSTSTSASAKTAPGARLVAVVDRLCARTIEAIKSNLTVRIGILATIVAVIAWQFLPPWLRLSVIFSIGAPAALGLAAGTAVGWLWLSWRLFAITAASVGGLAFLVLAVISGLAGCAGHSLSYTLDSIVTHVHPDELRRAQVKYDKISAEISCEKFIDVSSGRRAFEFELIGKSKSCPPRSSC